MSFDISLYYKDNMEQWSSLHIGISNVPDTGSLLGEMSKNYVRQVSPR